MSKPAFSDFSFGIAYEQLLTVRQLGLLDGILTNAVPRGGEWLDLQWTIKENRHFLWRHRFDRLNFGWTPTDATEITVGRQAMSWATTLFLTPGDPFIPFDPADPFREFRAGVDALRLRIYPGPLSELDFVARPTKNGRREGNDGSHPRFDKLEQLGTFRLGRNALRSARRSRRRHQFSLLSCGPRRNLSTEEGGCVRPSNQPRSRPPLQPVPARSLSGSGVISTTLSEPPLLRTIPRCCNQILSFVGNCRFSAGTRAWSKPPIRFIPC